MGQHLADGVDDVDGVDGGYKVVVGGDVVRHLVDGDLVAGACGVNVCGHSVSKEVEAAPGELDAWQGEHTGELARHVHLQGGGTGV